jgi:hypothetical protein
MIIIEVVDGFESEVYCGVDERDALVGGAEEFETVVGGEVCRRVGSNEGVFVRGR